MFKLLLAIYKLNSLYKDKNALENLPNVQKEERILHESFFSIFYTDIKTNYIFCYPSFFY
jgi:hypothetical protein